MTFYFLILSVGIKSCLLFETIIKQQLLQQESNDYEEIRECLGATKHSEYSSIEARNKLY